MKKIVLLLFSLTAFILSSWGFEPTAANRFLVADTLKVRFTGDTTTVMEGDSIWITVQLLGQIPKDSTIEVKYTIKSTDATVSKDFKFRGGTSFTFRATDATIQNQQFELLTTKDNNEERESITLELTIVKGGKITKIVNGKLVITLKDLLL